MKAVFNKILDGIGELVEGHAFFQGPFASEGPDYVIALEPTYSLSRIDERGLIKRAPDHYPQGVFMAFGNSVHSSYEMLQLKPESLVPTILACLGLPIPIDTDGEIILQVAIDHGKRVDYSKTWKLYRKLIELKHKLAMK